MQWIKDVPEDVCNIWIGSFLLGVIIPFIIYWYSNRKYTYWRDKGVKYAEPQSLFESFLYSQKPIQEVQFERYNKLGRIYGLYDAAFAVGQPALTVGEPELLKDIMVKDFHFFPNRRDLGFRDNSVFNRMLLLLRDEDWKRVRSVVSPAFSTGKIKRVLGVFTESSKTLLQNFKMAVQKGEYIEIKGLYGAFAMDVIACAAFSTKIDSHNDSENKFVSEARKIVSTSQGRFVSLSQKLPVPIRKIAFKLFATRRFKLFIDTTLQIIAERRKTGETKNDFLQLLLDAATETSKNEDSDEAADIAANYEDNSTNHHIFKVTSANRISKNELVAQSLIFFLAGYHSTTTTLSMVTYLLALNLDVQERAYDEIKEVLKETNGELVYESLLKMKMIDNIISETLRLYPPFPTIERIAASEYKIRNTEIVIPKGMTVEIPVYSMNRDPEFFPDPERFDPDRFSPEQKSQQIPYSYLPFGTGPRNCIGMRFALMEIKMCLIHVLSAFKIKSCPDTKVPLEFVSSRNFLQFKDIIVQMKVREDCPLKK